MSFLLAAMRFYVCVLSLCGVEKVLLRWSNVRVGAIGASLVGEGESELVRVCE